MGPCVSVLSFVLVLTLAIFSSISDATTLTYKLPVGAACHPNSYQKCDRGLTCEDEECRINDNGLCISNPASCLSGRVCVGTSSKKRCKVPMGPGDQCERDPFWVCRSSLTCVSNICKIGQGGVCTDYPDECLSGLDCVGSGSKKRCSKLMDAGGQCEVDPWWVCKSGLVCEDKECKIPQGDVCTANPDECASGLACVGSGRTKRCNKPMGPGEQCEVDPWWVCQDGLVCEDEECKIPQGGVCTETPHECASGLDCVGSGRRKRCNKLMDVGGQCEVDPWWVCKPGLVCQDKECKIPRGGVCTSNPDQCASGLACVGSGSTKRCNKLMGPGDRCEVDPWWVCQPGLTCVKNRCKIPANGSCTDNTDDCVSGLACVGTSSSKRCKQLMDIGGRCEVDPYWVCKPGLPCQGNVCRIPENGSCTHQEDLCAEGTNCIGKDNDYKCKAPVGLGGDCGMDVFSVCGAKLACDKRKWKCIDNGYDCKYSGKGCPDW